MTTRCCRDRRELNELKQELHGAEALHRYLNLEQLYAWR